VKIKRGSTSVRRLIFVADSSSTTGAGLANLVFNTASLVGYYFAGDLSNEVSITLATATLGTWASGGFIAVDNTNMPGWYEIGIPDAALDGGNEVAIQLRGAANMVPVNIYIELDAFDYQTATQPVNVTQISGDSGAADNAEAFFDGTGYAGTNNVMPTVTTLTNLPTIPANWLTAAGLAADAVTEIQSGLATSTNVSDAQTAIITQVDANETKIDAVKAKTDNLPSDPADQSAVEAAITAATSPLATAANLATVAGYLDTEIADILADTNELQAAWADGGRLDLILDARASQTSVDDLPTNAELATALGTADDAVLAAIATVQSDTNDIQTRLPAALESGRIAAVLDSAVAAQITAIETFATRVTTGIVQDGAVWQFTANMLELGPSGSSVVTVLPATGIVADRSAGVTLTPVVGETISQSITLYRTDGTTPVSLSGKTLAIVFETLAGVDVATVASGNITISGASSNVVTFAYPSAVTASERTLRFAIRDAAAPSTMYLQGVCSVVRAPQVDA
jgi:hypothetical protein